MTAPTQAGSRSHAAPGVWQRELRARYLGRLDYRAAERFQSSLRDRLLQRDGDEALLLLEHDHTFTLGRSATAEHVLADRHWLERRGVEVIECDRGGEVTYHGPGQLVGYPIIDLDPDRRDLRRYVADLTQVLVLTLGDFGIEAFAGERERIGVWVDTGASRLKIASIGVHVKRWVTTHGFALNVSTDLSLFSGIVACGMRDAPMVSMQQLLGESPSLEEVSQRCAEHFARRFERRLRPFSRAEQALYRRAVDTVAP